MNVTNSFSNISNYPSFEGSQDVLKEVIVVSNSGDRKVMLSLNNESKKEVMFKENKYNNTDRLEKKNVSKHDIYSSVATDVRRAEGVAKTIMNRLEYAKGNDFPYYSTFSEKVLRLASNILKHKGIESELRITTGSLNRQYDLLVKIPADTVFATNVRKAEGVVKTIMNQLEYMKGDDFPFYSTFSKDVLLLASEKLEGKGIKTELRITTGSLNRQYNLLVKIPADTVKKAG